MINILGFQRVVILTVLVSFNVIAAYALYGIYIDSLSQNQRQLKTIQSQMSSKQAELQDLRLDFESLLKQFEQFKLLEQKGFFNDQNRFDAQAKLKDLQDQAALNSMTVNIGGGTLQSNAIAAKIKHDVLSSPITLDLEASDDIQIYRYIHLLKTRFPGVVRIDSINLTRSQELTGGILRNINLGQNPTLVTAQVKMSWQTLIPKE